MSMQYFMLITNLRNIYVTQQFYQHNTTSKMKAITYFKHHNEVSRTENYKDFTRLFWSRYNNNDKRHFAPIGCLNFGTLFTRQLISHPRADLCSAQAAGRPKLPKHYLQPSSLPQTSRSSILSGNTTITGSTTKLDFRPPKFDFRPITTAQRHSSFDTMPSNTSKRRFAMDPMGLSPGF
jgi:hypothetical protein